MTAQRRIWSNSVQMFWSPVRMCFITAEEYRAASPLSAPPQHTNTKQIRSRLVSYRDSDLSGQLLANST